MDMAPPSSVHKSAVKFQRCSKEYSLLVQAVEMVSQDVAQPAKLCCALVDQAELEGLGCCHGIQPFQLHVASEHIQNGAVCLPQKLEPGRYKLSVRAILRHKELLVSLR